MASGRHLIGMWYNELGSRMNITSVHSGMLTGVYNTKVGNAKYDYVMTGRYDFLEDRRSLGWTVTWVNGIYDKSKSTTCWCGQYQCNPDTKEPQILTTWLLTTQTNPVDDWNSTNVGQDVFTRSCPSQEIIQKTKLKGLCSHPREAQV